MDDVLERRSPSFRVALWREMEAVVVQHRHGHDYGHDGGGGDDESRAFRAHISVFYSSHDAAERRASEEWLGAFVKTDGAWQACFLILESGGGGASDVESLFSARTLHDLLRRCVAKDEKKQASHAIIDWEALRFRLVRLNKLFAERCANGGGNVDLRATLTQLSLALAALACKMPSWDPNGVVDQTLAAFNEDETTSQAAKVMCLTTFLAIVAEQAASRDLSIHPMRREAVLTGLKNSVSTVMDVLGRLADAAGGDAALHTHILDALGSWAEIANVAQALPTIIVDGAVHILCDDSHGSHIRQSAVKALKGVLVQCIWTMGDETLRQTLAQILAKLRGEVGAPGKSDEGRVLIVEVISDVACAALRDQRDATKNPLATGAKAAGDRQYVKYKEFKHMQREQKKIEKAERKKTNLAVDIDEEVLVFSLDALSEGLAQGVSISSAMEPWSKLAKCYMPDELVHSLRPVAARCVQAAVMHVCSCPKDELEDDQRKEEISDCLRDVISAVPIDFILDDFNARFVAELQAAISSEMSWNVIASRSYVLLAIVKLFQSDVDQGSFTNLVSTLCAMLMNDASIPVAINETVCWVIAGLAKCITSLEDAHLLVVTNSLIESMRHPEFVVSRGAAVAMMRISEQASSRLVQTDVPSRLAALHTSGGPTPSTSLRLGQEHESTILLRCLTFYVGATNTTSDEATEQACASLAQPVIEMTRTCFREGVVEPCTTSERVRRLVDLDIVLRALKRAFEHLGKSSVVLCDLIASSAAVLQQASTFLVHPTMVEERFKMGWCLKALVDLVQFAGSELMAGILTIAAEAYTRAPQLGSCYLDALCALLEKYGDVSIHVALHGVSFHSTGHVVSEMLASILPSSLDDPEGWIAAFSLTRVCIRSGCSSLCAHVPTIVEVSRRSLNGVSNEAAAAALLLACDLLCAPILLTDSAPPNTSSGAMSSGMGRLAAEISGAKKKGAHAWNTTSEGSKALANAMAATLEVQCAVLVRALLEAGNGAMPPSMITDISACLHQVWSTYGDEAFSVALTKSLGGKDDRFPKKNTSMEDKREWVVFLTQETCKSDARVFKRMLKSFLGGKKVGKN